MNPVGSLPIFAGLTDAMPNADSRATARRTAAPPSRWCCSSAGHLRITGASWLPAHTAAQMQTAPPAAIRPTQPTRPLGRAAWLAVAGFGAIALLLTFTLSIRRGPIPDENPFIAAPALLLRTGALPYRDYLYYHTPTLVFVYAGLFALTDHLLLAARTFNAACAAAAVTAVYCVSLRWLAPLGRRGRWAPLGIALLYLFNPAYTYTAGQAWNHDFPTLACLLGLLALMRGIDRPATGRWATLAGVGVGLAITSRLTYAVVPPAFIALICLRPGLTRRGRVRLLALLALGATLAALPSIWVFAQSPANAWFGNFDYPALSTRYHAAFDPHHGRSVLLRYRLLYVLVHVFGRPGNAIGLGLFAFVTLRALWGRDVRTDPRRSELFALALLAILLGMTAFAPSPMYQQYMYAPVPFVLLGVARGLSIAPDLLARAAFRRTLTAAVIVTVGFGAAGYRGLTLLPHVHDWQPVKVHDQGMRIAALTAGRRVLTLDPIYPLEGRLPIFPRFAASRFVVRAADYVAPDLRRRLRMIDGPGVLDLYRADPRLPLLTTGVYPPAEAALTVEAQRRGRRPVPLWDLKGWRKGTLWLPPGPPADDRPPASR